jgi:Short C-terminal domain
MRQLFGLMAIAVLTACESAPPVQPAASSESKFKGAVFSGETLSLDKPTPGETSYRLFRQGGSGFVSLLSVRSVVEEDASRFCDVKGKTMHGLVETDAKPPFIFGNFPRVELIFECVTRPGANAGSASKYDKLEALKKLLDSGALTQREFDAEKAKILAEQ